MFAERVLIAISCSVTTTASDDEFNIPTNTLGWNRSSHFPPLAGLAGMYRIFSPNSRIGVLSLRPCSLCSGVFPSLPMSHLFIKYAANPTNQQYPCVGEDSGPNAVLQCSPQCPGLAGNELHRTLDEPFGLTFFHWRSLWNSMTPFLAGLCNRWLVVAPERDSVLPELTDELRCSLCYPGELRSFSRNQHSARDLVSPFPDHQHRTHTILAFLSFSPRNPKSIDTCGTPSTSS